MNWGCVSKANHFFKRMWYCTTITWKHDSSVSLGFKTMSIFHDLCHTKVRIPIVYEKYMTWTYPLELCILCYIHIPVHLMLQSGDISCFLFQGGISSWNLPHFEPNDYHCSKECIVQLNRCFSLGQASSFQTSYLIMTISQRTQEHEDSLLSSAGNKPLSMKKWKKDIKWSLTWITWGPLFHEYLTLVVLMGRDSTVGSDSQVMRFNLWMNGHRAWWCEACQCHLDENWTPRSEMRLSN